MNNKEKNIDIKSYIDNKFLNSGAKSFFKTQEQGEKILAGFWYEVARNKKILGCTKESILLSLHKSAQYDLSAGSKQECCYLPRQNKKTGSSELEFTPMVNGFIKLAFRSGVKNIISEVIHENDYIEIDQGTSQSVVFRKNLNNRGEEVGAFCQVIYNTINGTTGSSIEVVDKKDIAAFQKLAMTNMIWDSDFRSEMIRRSVIKRCLKRCPSEAFQSTGFDKLLKENDLDPAEFNNQMLLSNQTRVNNPLLNTYKARVDQSELLIDMGSGNSAESEVANEEIS